MASTIGCLGNHKRSGVGKILGPFPISGRYLIPCPFPAMEVVTPAGRYLWEMIPDEPNQGGQNAVRQGAPKR
jgi:hypothetical protein